MRIKKGLLLSFSIFALVACSSENSSPAASAEEGNEVTEEAPLSEEEIKTNELIENMKLYSQTKNVENFTNEIRKAKADELVNEEMIEISDSFIKGLIEEKDIPFLKDNYGKITIINSISVDNKHVFRDFIRSETAPKLDEMELAIKNRNFETVEKLYNSEPILADNDEASAMYAYATYLQTEPKSQEASATLGIAVDSEYNGRMRQEILEGITDTSYVSLEQPFVTPFIESDWRNIEVLYEEFKKNQTFFEQNKAAGEAERAEAVGKNPSIGMTAAQVEASLWGKPLEINRTVTQYSEHEQWVYGNGQYLYFTDGILTSFQD